MKNFQESDFKIEIPTCSKDTGSNTVFYDVLVTYQEKKWKLVKRYSEFEDLHNRLNKIILNMPYLPAKSLFKLTGVEIEKRRLDLEKYIRALSLRKDIVQLSDFLSFIDFESYTTSEIFSPIEIGSLLNLPMSVTDFIFIQEAGILFVSLSDTSILSKMDDIFSTFTSKTANDIRGSVLAYKLQGNNPLKFHLLWKKDFKAGTTCLYWDEALTFLAVGFDDGACECIRVSTEHYYNEYDEFCIVRRHTSRVMGCGFFSLLATLYTISKDKTLVVTDITKTVNFALEEKTFLNELTYLLIDNQNKRMFISDVTGTIHIYGLDIPLQLFHKIPCEYPQNFTTLSMDIKKRFLLAGSTQGMIYIYELGKPGKEKLISLTSKIEASKNLKTVVFSILDKTLYFNYGNTVIFMDSTQALPFYSLDRHRAEIVKILLLDSEKVLITASKDKSIKFWKLKDVDGPSDSLKEKNVEEKSEKTEKDCKDLFEKIDTLKPSQDTLKASTMINPLKDRGEFLFRQKTEPISEKIQEIPPLISQIKEPLQKSNTFNPLLEIKANQEPFIQKEKGSEMEKNVENEKSNNEKSTQKQSKPLFEADDENELNGWYDDSKIPAITEHPSLSNPKKTNEIKIKPTSKDAPMFEEDANDLMGWDSSQNQEMSYAPIKNNPLLANSLGSGKVVQTLFQSKPSEVSSTHKKEPATQKSQMVKKKYEEEEDLNGWNN